MRPAAWLCSLALLFAGLPRGLAGNSTAGHARRQTDMMYPDSVVAGTFPLGLVMVDGQQSFCPIILVSTTAGVAAASCFDYDQSGQVNAAPYSIATGGQAQPVANRAQITVVAKHPGYDPQSFANNIAVVRFNEIPLPITQKNGVGVTPSRWSRILLVHRTLTADGNAWNNYEFADTLLADTNQCNKASNLFCAYQNDYMCSSTTRRSIYNQQCVLPYKYVLALNGESLAQLGFYSHSAISDDSNFCSTSTMFNYYLFIANYIPWINQLIDPDIGVVTPSGMEPIPTDPGYTMARPAQLSSGSWKMFSIYRNGVVLPRPMASREPAAAPLPPAKARVSTKVVVRTEVVSERADPVTVTESTTVLATTTIVSATAASTTVQTTTTAHEMSTDVVDVTVTEVHSEEATATLVVTSTAPAQPGPEPEPVCPPITPCLSLESHSGEGSAVTVTQTHTTTETATQTSVSVIVEPVTAPGTGGASAVATTITVTVSERAGTVTETVTEEASAGPVATVTVTEGGPGSSKASTETIESTVVVPGPAAGAGKGPRGPSTGTLAAMVAIIAGALLAALALLCLCCRRKSKGQHSAMRQTTDYNAYPPPPSYFGGLGDKEGGGGGGSLDDYYLKDSYTQPEVRRSRQSRYNSNGSYVGYM